MRQLRQNESLKLSKALSVNAKVGTNERRDERTTDSMPAAAAAAGAGGRIVPSDDARPRETAAGGPGTIRRAVAAG